MTEPDGNYGSGRLLALPVPFGPLATALVGSLRPLFLGTRDVALYFGLACSAAPS